MNPKKNVEKQRAEDNVKEKVRGSAPYRKATWERTGLSATCNNLESDPPNHTEQLSFTVSQGTQLSMFCVKCTLDTGSSNFIFDDFLPVFSKVGSNSISPSSPLPKTDCKMKNKTCVCKKPLSFSLTLSLLHMHTNVANR